MYAPDGDYAEYHRTFLHKQYESAEAVQLRRIADSLDILANAQRPVRLSRAEASDFDPSIPPVIQKDREKEEVNG